MPPKRRRRFHGLYYHSSPPKVLSMNGQVVNGSKSIGRDDVFVVKPSNIRIWIHEKDIGKLTKVLWAGHGNRLRSEASTNPKVKKFLEAVPYVMNVVKDVHQAVIDNSLEVLQAKLEPPVPVALVTTKDANGLNVIHKAAGLGHTMILEYLLSIWPEGAMEIDMTGKTPLHWAASAKNNLRCYSLLTQAGCDEDALDYKMKTPAYYKQKSNDIEKALLTVVPDAPRVSRITQLDWSALSSDGADLIKSSESAAHLRRQTDFHDNDLNSRSAPLLDTNIESVSEIDYDEGLTNGNHDLSEAIEDDNDNVVNGTDLSSKETTPETSSRPSSPPPADNEIDETENVANNVENNYFNNDIIENNNGDNINSDIKMDNENVNALNGNAVKEHAAGDNLRDEIDGENGVDDGTLKNSDMIGNGDETENENEFEIEKIKENNDDDEDDDENADDNEWAKLESKVNGITEEALIEETNHENETNEIDVPIKDLIEELEDVVANKSDEYETTEESDEKVEESNNNLDNNGDEIENDDDNFGKTDNDETDDDLLFQKEQDTDEESKNFESLDNVENVPINDSDEIEDNNDGFEDSSDNQENDNSQVQGDMLSNMKKDDLDDNVNNDQDDDDDDQDLNENEDNPNEPKSDENHNSIKLENGDNRESPSPSLAIEGFIHEDSQDSQVQSESAVYHTEDKKLQQILNAGDMEQLAILVLNGDGKKLLNLKSELPEIQAFLTNVPAYMSKIRRVHEAARNGSLRDLQAALDRRKFAIAKDEISPDGATPLHVAVIFGHSDIVRYLAGRFPETMSSVDDNGRTALHYAAVIKDNGHFFNLLSHLGSNFNAKDKLENTPEFYLNHEKSMDILSHRQLLIKFDAEGFDEEMLNDQGRAVNHTLEIPLFKTEQGRYLANSLGEPLIKGLTEIAETRPSDPVAYLAAFLQNFVHARNQGQMTGDTTSTAIVTNEAGPSDNLKSTNQIQKDDEVSSPETTPQEEDRDEHGQSMLHFACARAHGRNGLLSLIEESQINITYRDELYRTARDVSLQASQPGNAKEIDRYILTQAVVGDVKPFEDMLLSGYDHILDISDDNENSIIDVVVSRGHDKLANFLGGALQFEELREDLHQAIREKNFDKVQELTALPIANRLIRAKNYYGRTSLHIAILKEMEEIVEYLVNTCPESLKIGDNLERTPLHYAMGVNSVEGISRILIRKGAKRTAKDLKGRQPSYYFMNKADVSRLQEEEEVDR